MCGIHENFPSLRSFLSQYKRQDSTFGIAHVSHTLQPGKQLLNQVSDTEDPQAGPLDCLQVCSPLCGWLLTCKPSLVEMMGRR